MHRSSRTRFVVALSALIIAQSSLLLGAVPANETLLPDSTKGALLIHNVDELSDAFDRTQMGQLLKDPLMQPFMEDIQEQMKAKWRKSRGELGIAWSDLEDVASGEVAIARTVPAPGKSATVVLADITGNTEKAEKLLDKISAALIKKKATKTAETIENVVVAAFDIPPSTKIRRRNMYYAIHNNLLIVAGNKEVMAGIIKRQASKDTQGSLAEATAFRASIDRATRDAGSVVPHLRFFIEPIAYFQAIRSTKAGPRKRGTDMLKIASEQGFDAIKGVAGVVNFSLGDYEMLYRVSVYAPPIAEAKADRYLLAMRMLSFFNDMNLDPPAWVHTELATFTRLKLDISKTFESAKTLVNAVADSEVFEDVLDSLKTAPDGPKIDIREHVIKRLGGDVIILSDYELPITVTSERLLFAIETNDAEALAATVAKAMKADDQAHRREFKVGDKTYIIWEMVEHDPEDSAAPVVELGGIPGLPGVDEDEEDDEEEPLLPNKAVTVAHGRLMIASHIQFLHKVLENAESRAHLADSVDFKLVATELERIGGKKMFVRNFSRTDEEYRPTYELIKQGQMPQSKTMLGMMLNRWLAADLEEGEVRAQQIDGSKLPDFEICRRYLGPAGMLGIAEDNGWYIAGFVLSKENPSALQGSSAIVAEKGSDEPTRK
jgi:hypothetical protein